jgi:hypothetical protein
MESSGVVEKRAGTRKYELVLHIHQNPEIRSLISFIWRFEQHIVQHLGLGPEATFHSCIRDGNLVTRIPSMSDRINLQITDDNNLASIRTYFDIKADRQIKGKLMIKSLWKLMDGLTVKHYGLYICLMEANLRYPSAIRSSNAHIIDRNDNDRRVSGGVHWADAKDESTTVTDRDSDRTGESRES